MTEKMEKTPDQIKKEEYDAFVESLKGKTKEELEQIEQEVIAQCEAADKEVSEAKLKLPETGYTEVSKSIVHLLNKKSVTWQYTLAMINLINFWKASRQTEIPYPILDTTLRQLGELQFTGSKEWQMVIDITNFFEGLRGEYVELTNRAFDLASRHDAVMNALGLQNPIQVNEGEGPQA